MEEVYIDSLGLSSVCISWGGGVEGFTMAGWVEEGGTAEGEEEEGAASTEESTIMELRMSELPGGVGLLRNTDSVYCVYCLGVSLSTLLSLCSSCISSSF